MPRVRDVMTRDVEVIGPDETLQRAAQPIGRQCAKRL